jgi:hypothetical protein
MAVAAASAASSISTRRNSLGSRPDCRLERTTF